MAAITQTHFNYLKWNDIFRTVKPYLAMFDVPEGEDAMNFELAPGPEQIVHDIRHSPEEYSLDKHAFCMHQWPTNMQSWTPQSIQQQYYPEIEHLIRSTMPTVKEIVLFDFRLRSSQQQQVCQNDGATFNLNDKTVHLGPVSAVHIDQSEAGATARVRKHMGARADHLLKGRFQIINIWRPICDKVQDWPLAVCDGSSLINEKLMTVDYVRKGHIGEAIYPMYSDQYRWYYISEQSRDEVLMLKIFDSKPPGRARYCPHSAFRPTDWKYSDNIAPRESIEVRALIFS